MTSTLTIRALAPDAVADMDGFQRVYVESESHANPGGRLYTREEGEAALRTQGAWFTEGYGAFLDGEMVGESMVMGSRRDNLDRAHLLLWVVPTAARRGVGSALLAHAESRVAELGRSLVEAEVQLGGPGRPSFLGFAQRHGYALVQEQVERQLALPVADGLLDRLEAATLPHASAYTLRVAEGPVPADLADGYARLLNRLNIDAPAGGEAPEHGARTAQDIADQDQEIHGAGRRRLTVFALSVDGQVAGFSCAIASPVDHRHIDQQATIVAPEHRGHRLGTLVKVALVRELQRAFPDKRVVHTENAETNAHMVAINEALGFRLTSRRGELQKRLRTKEDPA